MKLTLAGTLTRPPRPLGRVRSPFSDPRLIARLRLLVLDAEDMSILYFSARNLNVRHVQIGFACSGNLLLQSGSGDTISGLLGVRLDTFLMYQSNGTREICVVRREIFRNRQLWIMKMLIRDGEYQASYVWETIVKGRTDIPQETDDDGKIAWSGRKEMRKEWQFRRGRNMGWESL